MAESTPPAFTRFVERERRAGRLSAAPERLPTGEALDPLLVARDDLDGLAVEAAKRAAGFFRPTRRDEVAWIDGDSALAVSLAGIRLDTADGVVVVTLPVRSDQTGRAELHVTFAVGRPGQPAGLYAAAQRRPRGPALLVDTWGDAAVAFAWQVLLELAAGLAGAAGKDARGNRLVPVELEASRQGIAVVPMARHRFTGSPGLAARRR